MATVAQAVRRNVKEFISQAGISPQDKGLGFKPKDILLINNSFIFREKKTIKTTKSKKYVCVHVTSGSNFSQSPQVATGININSDYRRIPASDTNRLSIVTLKDALKSELNSLGKLVFILIGHIDDSIVNRYDIHDSDYSELVWDPSSKDPVTLVAPTITIADARNESEVWADIEVEFGRLGVDIPDGLHNAFAIAIEKLKDEAIANLVLPSAGNLITPHMTESIVQVLQEQRDEYADALAKSRKEKTVSNDILRIAYNFASDAITFIRLIVSICDLKPVVLWGTMGKHFALAEALRNLPWHRHRNKPALSNYRATIADARNSAFHNLFPFRKSLDVSLPEDSLQEAKMRIFSEHTRKKQNVLIYQDKELVDLLFEFTRARERQVSLQFWEKNLEVMDATIELCDATGDFLTELLVEVGT
jgi:hypothetical protein